MKRILSVLFGAMLATSAWAAPHQVQSFLNGDVTSLCIVSALGVTNLLSTVRFVGTPTNVIGVFWTNAAGNKVSNTVLNATAYNTDKKNLLADVNLWDTGDPGFMAQSNNLSAMYSNVRLVVRLGPGSGGALTMRFVGVPNGVDEDEVPINAWQITVASAAARTTIATNVPLYNWRGYDKLRLQELSAATGPIYVEKVQLVGFIP